MFEIQMVFQQSEVRPENGKWAVYVRRELFGTYDVLTVALKTAKSFDGQLLD